MNNFILNLSTELHFGKDMLETLPTNIKKHTNKPILFTYGGGSLKRSGLYDKIISLLNANDIDFFELGGIKPNPEVDTARAGIKLIRDNNIDFILAVGGGSVLDNSKHMAAGVGADCDIWDVITNPNAHQLDASKVPSIGSIITVAATGSEMNNGGVMTNPEFDLKLAYSNKLLAPKFTYEDPTVLETLPEWHRRAGICDILSHLFEKYFGSHQDDGIDDRLVEAIMKNTIAYGEDYLKTNNYESLANIFYSSTLALNGLTGMTRVGNDWRSHGIEHEVSAVTDLTHGIGLAIIHPKVLEYYFNKDTKEGNSTIKFENIGVSVFEFDRNDPKLAEKTINAIKDVFAKFGSVTYLDDVEISKGTLDDELIAKRVSETSSGAYYQLTLEETREVVQSLYK